MLQDDRTEAQKQTHRLAWVGTDSFMSGWGKAAGGASYAGWAYTYETVNACEDWVRQRGDMKRARLVALDGYRPSAAHTHIYIYDGQHNHE